MSSTDIWQKLSYDVGRSDEHFARSDALVRHVSLPTLWWHSTEEPTLILGTGQSLEHFNLEACVAGGVRVMRRNAGGTAVFAEAGVLGLDVALPIEHPLVGVDIVEGYRWLGEVWNDSLHLLGVNSRVVDIQEARRATQTGSWDRLVRLACFGSLSPYEVVVGGRKLVGLAQVRRRAGILLQSGIHRRFDAARLATLLTPSRQDELAEALRNAAVGLDELVGEELTDIDIMETFETCLKRRFGLTLVDATWTAPDGRQRSHRHS